MTSVAVPSWILGWCKNYRQSWFDHYDDQPFGLLLLFLWKTQFGFLLLLQLIWFLRFSFLGNWGCHVSKIICKIQILWKCSVGNRPSSFCTGRYVVQNALIWVWYCDLHVWFSHWLTSSGKTYDWRCQCYNLKNSATCNVSRILIIRKPSTGMKVGDSCHTPFSILPLL